MASSDWHAHTDEYDVEIERLDEFDSESPAAEASITLVPAPAGIPLIREPEHLFRAPESSKRFHAGVLVVPGMMALLLGAAIAAFKYATPEPVGAVGRAPLVTAAPSAELVTTAARAVPPPIEPVVPAAEERAVESAGTTVDPPAIAVAATSATRPATALAAPPPDTTLQAGVMAALDVYRRAYGARDAALVYTIYPGADTEALSRAFSTLRYQSVTFDRCEVRAAGPARAAALCDASISTVAQTGTDLIRRRERLTFSLVLGAGGWRIGAVTPVS